MSTQNYSIHAFTAFYLLAFVPQFYATAMIYRATNGRFNNVNPRSGSTAETYQKACDKATFSRFERARAAHANAMENLPLFAAAVISANMAGLDIDIVNTVCGIFLGLRVLHTALYIAIEKAALSRARSFTWMCSAGCCLYLLVKSGNVLMDGKGARAMDFKTVFKAGTRS